MTTGILFGLAPALRATRIDLYPALKEGGRRATVGPRQNRVRNSLVTAQVALSMVLVIGAGLLIRTLRNLDQVDLGFNREHVLLAEVYPLTLGYEGVKEIALYKQLLQEIRAIPGVRCASLSRIRLTEGHSKRLIMVQDRSTQGVEAMEVSWNAVAPRFFETMQIPLLAGRDFSDADTERAERVVVINQALARLRFPGQNPIGKRIRFREEESSGEIEIIGVVRDTRAITVRKYDTTGEVYVPFAQSPGSTRDRFTLAIHAAGSPMGIVASLRQAVRTVDPDLALVDIGTQKETMSRSFRAENALARLTGIFGALALLLASIGLYGTMSYVVARRTNEIGIRMALGALRGHVVWLALVENLRLVIAGVAVGIPAALAASRLISSLLFGVAPADALTISSAVLIMAAVAAAAGYLPLLRASRVDPIIALRCE